MGASSGRSGCGARRGRVVWPVPFSCACVLVRVWESDAGEKDVRPLQGLSFSRALVLRVGEEPLGALVGGVHQDLVRRALLHDLAVEQKRDAV
jgi:hypothetical protein